MSELEYRCTSPQGRVRSASVSSAFGEQPSISLEVYGTTPPQSFTLELLQDGILLVSKNYVLNDPSETGGYDIRVGEYRGGTARPRDLGQHSPPYAGLENVPMGSSATLDDFFGAVSTTNPNADPPETQARDALAGAGIALVVIDGPGVWREPPEGDSMAFEDTSAEEYLGSTLLKTGARWWLDGDTLTIDGSAAPATFALPASDLNLITGYSYADETPDLEPPSPDPAPRREDYLSTCPEYEPPPGEEPVERSPETIMQGVFRYRGEVGEGDERFEYERVNIYYGRLEQSELIERGFINTPAGRVFGVRSRVLSKYQYHPMCKEAVVKETNQTFAAPDMSEAGTNTDVEEAEATWLALGGAEMYLASESIKEIVYHSSGYLKEETETTRELELLSLKEGDDGPVDFEIVYNTRTRQILNEPNAGGRWVQYTTERQTENVVVYAKEDPDPETGKVPAAPARVQRASRTTSRAEPSDAAPAQLTCSPPDPEDPDAPPETAPCLEKREHEFQKALQAWAAREALKTAEYESRLSNIGNQPRRVHSVNFGIPRLDIGLNDLYGGATVAGQNLSYSDDGQTVSATSSLTVWQRRTS